MKRVTPTAALLPHLNTLLCLISLVTLAFVSSSDKRRGAGAFSLSFMSRLCTYLHAHIFVGACSH